MSNVSNEDNLSNVGTLSPGKLAATLHLALRPMDSAKQPFFRLLRLHAPRQEQANSSECSPTGRVQFSRPRPREPVGQPHSSVRIQATTTGRTPQERDGGT